MLTTFSPYERYTAPQKQFRARSEEEVLESIRLIGDACLAFNDNCAVGIEPNLERIEHNLAINLMQVTALNKHIGYDKAADLSKEAYKTGRTIREVARERTDLPEEQLDDLLDARKMT